MININYKLVVILFYTYVCRCMQMNLVLTYTYLSLVTCTIYHFTKSIISINSICNIECFYEFCVNAKLMLIPYINQYFKLNQIRPHLTTHYCILLRTFVCALFFKCVNVSMNKCICVNMFLYYIPLSGWMY